MDYNSYQKDDTQIELPQKRERQTDTESEVSDHEFLLSVYEDEDYLRIIKEIDSIQTDFDLNNLIRDCNETIQQEPQAKQEVLDKLSTVEALSREIREVKKKMRKLDKEIMKGFPKFIDDELEALKQKSAEEANNQFKQLCLEYYQIGIILFAS